MSSCINCPRHCPARPGGFCGAGDEVILSRAGLHFWEEPCISGTRGAGTVFFSGCNLRCVYCQNYEISSCMQGKAVSIERLREIYFELIAQGAHTIDLVTPMHYSDQVLKSLEEPLPVPVVCNTNGYEDLENLRRWEGKAQVYLPDFKYSDNAAAGKYSSAPDYFERASAAIKEMFRQTGVPEYDSEGIMTKGVVVRHLMLPGMWRNTQGVIDFIASNFEPGEIVFCLMRQYIPHGRAGEFPEIDKRVSDAEYERAVNYMTDSGIEDGFIQDKESADSVFIPDFDGSGV
ncbi:MAG: 4Fe-4S cluster-binding domain-containing protein [Lentisphaeria bacterium]|nr:4Fe-4S cluster-binding domain-containing protein [Lentisphaeria bacterium]